VLREKTERFSHFHTRFNPNGKRARERDEAGEEAKFKAYNFFIISDRKVSLTPLASNDFFPSSNHKLHANAKKKKVFLKLETRRSQTNKETTHNYGAERRM
jgi:hypothetical protein